MSKGGGNVSTPQPEDYMPLVQQSADINRVNQVTPFGSTTWGTSGESPLGFDEWSAQNSSLFAPSSPQSSGPWTGFSNRGERGNDYSLTSRNTPDPRDLYNEYTAGFEGKPEVTQQFSPEIQGIFDKQFDPNAYDQYSDDFMSRYSELAQPDRDYAQNRFEQNMFDRGQPVGGAEYGDKYRQTIGDPQARQDIMAQGQAVQAGEQARLQDFNRLMAAMGGSQVQFPQIDTMGAANMAMNANVQNAQLANQQSSNIWNTGAQLGSAYLFGLG